MAKPQTITLKNGFQFSAVYANGWESWGFSLVGVPKLTFRCGDCQRVQKTRPDYDSKTGILHTCCAGCGTRNVFHAMNSTPSRPSLLTIG